MPEPATPPAAPVTPVAPDIPVADASETQEELDAKISQELDIPPVKTEDDKPAEPAVGEDPAPPEEPAADPETPEEPETPPEEPKPAEPATPSDEDLFIEVEDREGVTHKISSIEDLPADFEPKNNRQIMEIIKATDNLDNQRAEREVKAEEAAEAQAVQEAQTAQFKSWDAEITELAKTDRVDATDMDYLNDVFGHMNDINAARVKAGNPNLITSFEDALDKYEAKQAADKVEEDKKNENSKAKAKSALIGRSSAAAGGDRYVYKAGSARNIDDIPI